MGKKKQKYYLAKHNGVRDVLSGLEVSILQQSGAQVRLMRDASECPACSNRTYFHGECYHCGFEASEVDIY